MAGNKRQESEGSRQKAGSYGCSLAPHCLSRRHVSEWKLVLLFLWYMAAYVYTAWILVERDNKKNPAYGRHWISWLCADSSTYTKTDRIRQKGIKKKRKKKACVTCHISRVTCYVPRVMCRVSHVACHLSPVTNANSHSHRTSSC